MPTAAALLIAGPVVAQTGLDNSELPDNHLFYAARLIGALLVATLVPLLIDLRARNSTRVLR
jgi:hypothetical protein